MLGLELDVEHRADDLNDLSDVAESPVGSCHEDCLANPRSAAAPPTISAISCVMLRLTRAVVRAAEHVEHVARVVRRVLHRRALRARRTPPSSRPARDTPNCARRAEAARRGSLCASGRGCSRARFASVSGGVHRQDLLGRRRRRQHRLEVRIDHVHGVDLAARERRGEIVHQLGGVLRRRPIADVGAAARDRAADVAEVAEALLADDVQVDLDALALEPRDRRARFLDQVRVERAGETAVRREQNDRRALDLSPAGAAAGTARRARASRDSRSRRAAPARTDARRRTRSCARFIFDVATISIVRVILRVFSTDLMRPLSSRPLAMESLGRVCRGECASLQIRFLDARRLRRDRGLLVLLDAALEVGLDLLREHLLGADAARRPAGTSPP